MNLTWSQSLVSGWFIGRIQFDSFVGDCSVMIRSFSSCFEVWIGFLDWLIQWSCFSWVSSFGAICPLVVVRFLDCPCGPESRDRVVLLLVTADRRGQCRCVY